MSFRCGLAIVAALVASVAPPAVAQTASRCDLVPSPSTRITGYRLPSGEFNQFAGGGVVLKCPGRGITLKSDSLELYGDEKRVYLVGHVDYAEPRFTLTSEFLTYYIPPERIVATGNVHARLPTGSTMVGPQIEYLRVIPDVRPQAQLTAISRPTASIIEHNAEGTAQPPVMVTANTIFMDGDSLLYASGRVEIEREDLAARGDSVFLDSASETMRLMRDPVLEGRKDRPFTLTGIVIDMYSRNRQLNRILARGKAVAMSEDMNLRADTIDLRVTDDQLDRAMAWGASRAVAKSPAQNIFADSLDVHMPSQRVREVRAYGTALAEGRPDSVKFHADTTDWLRGDTILAYFDTLTAQDTTESPDIRRILALGNAQSFYHLAPGDTTLHRPAISYSRGREITISFDEARSASVSVTGMAAGMYAEPAADSTVRASQPPVTPPSVRPPLER